MAKSIGVLLFGTFALLSAPQVASAVPSAQAAKLHRDLKESGPAPRVAHVRAPQPEAFELFRGSRIFLRGTINGVDTGMMLDSGASMTVLDTEFARKIGVKGDRHMPIAGASGSIPGEIASNVSVGVGGLTMDGSDVIIMDLSPIARAIGRPIPVILGHDSLDSGPVTIDFQNRTMLFVPAAGFRAPTDAKKVELGHDGPFRSVKIAVAGLPPINATFDIGNGGTVLLSKSYWDGKSEIASLPGAETQLGGVGGMKIARKVTLPTVEFAGQTLKAVPAFLNQDPTALPTEGANLGIEMLKPFVVTLDYAHDAIYLKRSGQWTGFPRERAGIGTHLIDGRLKVTYVSPDGPAMTAGLKAGDEIVAVNGQAIAPEYYSTALARWNEGAPGSIVELSRADGTKARIKLTEYY